MFPHTLLLSKRTGARVRFHVVLLDDVRPLAFRQSITFFLFLLCSADFRKPCGRGKTTRAASALFTASDREQGGESRGVSGVGRGAGHGASDVVRGSIGNKHDADRAGRLATAAGQLEEKLQAIPLARVQKVLAHVRASITSGAERVQSAVLQVHMCLRVCSMSLG